MTLEEKRTYTEKFVTLDGKPARVSGALLQFPIVFALDGSAEFEYSWYAVKNVIENKSGKFYS